MRKHTCRERKIPEKRAEALKRKLISHPLDVWQTAKSPESSSYHKTSHNACPYAIIKAALSYKYQAVCDDKEMCSAALGILVLMARTSKTRCDHFSFSYSATGPRLEECLLDSCLTITYPKKTLRLEVRVMTKAHGGREPIAGMSDDKASRDTI